jgi:CRISPR/Cas system CSM-associated protein Csm2 small subunit
VKEKIQENETNCSKLCCKKKGKEQEIKARLPKLHYVLKFTKERKGKRKYWKKGKKRERGATFQSRFDLFL